GVVAIRNSLIVTRLVAAGAVLLGRANMDELAMGASTQTSAFGATRNPWDVRRSPGGSSGGSAAAVSAGLAALSIGTDTGGSIREPAAQCGVVGMAPSPGLVPVTGVVPFAPGLDRVGPLARSVRDAATMLAVMSGRRNLAAASGGDRPLRVGIVEGMCGRVNRPGVLARFAAACEVLADIGAEFVRVSLPDSAGALGAYLDITSAACAPFLEPYVRTGQAGQEVLRRWQIGRALLHEDAAELAHARRMQHRLIEQTRDALERCDVLLSPTMPTTAPLLTCERAAVADPMTAPYTDCWTVVANLTGLPALSLPAGTSPDDGLPVGVMLTGPPGSDGMLLAVAAAMEDRELAGSSGGDGQAWTGTDRGMDVRSGEFI
ncbi:MAG TPA: amidase, partial [Mycobacteriales bacterium]|nr:amidase [Mycobacteriales bacterium]